MIKTGEMHLIVKLSGDGLTACGKNFNQQGQRLHGTTVAEMADCSKCLVVYEQHTKTGSE